MTAKSAPPGKAPSWKRGKGGAGSSRIGLRFWVLALCCGGVVILAPGTAMMLAGLLLPVILVALIPDQSGGASLLHVAMLFGLAATAHPLQALWSGDTGPSGALALLRQPLMLLPAWIAIFIGWLVSEIATLVMRLHADIAAARQRRALMVIIEEIEDEWGPMPASAPLPPL